MKKIFALLLLTVITTLSFGQNNYQDVVYLKNGSIIRGVIIEQVPNKSIKIETADKSVFVYQVDDVEKFTKEPFVDKNNAKLKDIGLQKGYKYIVELGCQGGVGSFGLDRLKLNIIRAYQFNPYFSVGLGTGFHSFFADDALFIPVFADFRANFKNNKVSPYLSLGIGYSFEASNDFNGVGLLINPAAGVSFKVSEQLVMNAGLGLDIQNMEVWDFNNYESVSSTALSLNVGLTF